jgi:hypothetical protein
MRATRRRDARGADRFIADDFREIAHGAATVFRSERRAFFRLTRKDRPESCARCLRNGGRVKFGDQTGADDRKAYWFVHGREMRARRGWRVAFAG